jgi:hypothetical protein
MRTLVVYESVFGNTHKVADAIGRGVAAADPQGELAVLPVSEATADVTAGTDLLIVGGPTHMRGLSREMTRGGAIRDARASEHEDTLDPDAEGPGLRDWFDMLSASGHRAAAFDTRADMRLAGGAAKGIAKRLRRHGFTLIADPEGFFIEGQDGPLRDGELQRAESWGSAAVTGARTG